MSGSSDSSIPDNTIPEETCSWTGLLLPVLRVTVDTVTEDPLKIFESSYLDHFFRKKEGQTGNISDILSFFRKDHIMEMRQCFQRLSTEAIELDYEHFQEVPFQKVLELRNYLKLSKWSSNHEFPVEYGIQESLRRFYTQLLYMTRKRNIQQEVMEGMFQELFISFARIYGLEVHGFEDKSKFRLRIGDCHVTSNPDALICNSAFQDQGDNDIIAVVEVKKKYSREGDPESERTQQNKEIVTWQVPHVNDNVKAKHIGEMLAVLPYSVFGNNGLYGFIVQGTNVTVVSLKLYEGYYDSLKEGQLNMKNAVVQYSRECNFLSKEGRAYLSDVFFYMSKLQDYLYEHRLT